MQEDLALIERVRQGEQEAYAELINKYKQRVYVFLLRMLGQPQDAQDLAQEVFIKAYFQLGSFTGSSQFFTWLYRIAYNRAVDELRRRKSDKSVPLQEIELADYATPERIVLAKERTASLEKQALNLPESYRTVFLLRHTQQLSCKEIAEVLDIPPSTVQVRLHRARKKLRQFITSSEQGGDLHEVFDI